MLDKILDLTLETHLGINFFFLGLGYLVWFLWNKWVRGWYETYRKWLETSRLRNVIVHVRLKLWGE